MSNIIPFDDDNASSRLPAHLRSVDVAALNADLTGHAGAGFPVISIKGKVFTEVRGGERKIIPNPKDPESPATYIEVVLVKASKNKSKIWYESGFVEGAEQKKPDCYSTDGVTPAADSVKRQAKACATCKHNQWGAKITSDGRKAKACNDTVRLAIAKPDLLNDPYLLRVPPASIRPLGEYGQTLAKRGVGYNAVLTRISFDQAEATPKLVFKPVGFLDASTYQQVQEAVDSEVVKNILGASDFVVDAEEAAGEPQPQPQQEQPKPQPEQKAAKAEAVKQADVAITKARTVTTDEVVGTINKATQNVANVMKDDLGDLNLGDLNFDD